MIIAATFRLTDTDLDDAIRFWNDCLVIAQARGWVTDGSHAEFFDMDALPPVD